MRRLLSRRNTLLGAGLIILAVLGLGARYVYARYQAHKPATSAPAPAQAVTNQPDKTAVAGQAYLTIKEWGVRLPVTAGSGVSYFISASTPNIASFSTRALSKLDAGCSATSGSAGEIERLSPSTKVSEDHSGDAPTAQTAYAVSTDHSGLSKVGNYYYLFHHAQSACGTVSDNQLVPVQTAANNQIKAASLDLVSLH